MVAGQVSVDSIANEHGSRTGLLGGAATYVAAASAALGARTALVAGIGSDLPSEMLEPLVAAGVDCRWLVRSSRPTTRIELNYANQILTRIDIREGAAAALPARTFARSGATYRALHLTPGPEAALMRLVRSARLAGARVSFDPHLDFTAENLPALRRLLAFTDILFLNRTECQLATGHASAGDGARSLLALGPALVLVTDGPHGATVTSRNGTSHVPTVPDPAPVDAVGAGDTFAAGFLRALDGGATPEEAAAAGHRCARTIIGGFGMERIESLRRLPRGDL